MDSSQLNGSLESYVTVFLSCDKQSIYSKLWIILSAACVIVGIPACVIVLKELCKRLRQRDSNELFMLNMTSGDLAFVILISVSVADYMHWGYMDYYCFNNFLDALTLCCRPLFMSGICLDCYFAVVHPIPYRTNKKISFIRKMTSLIVWMSTIFFGLFTCLTKLLAPYAFYSVPLFVALPVIAFCDISILRALRKPDPTGRSNIHPLKSRALHTIFNSLTATFIAYLPPVFIFSMADVIPVKMEDYYCKVLVFGFYFAMSGSVIMPVLYLDTVGKLNYLKKLFK